MAFTTFIPTFGNKNHNIRYFAHLNNGTKKELKHFENNIFYYCINRKRNFVKISGNLYNKNFEELQDI